MHIACKRVLPSSIEEIGESAFEGCSKLTSITIPVKVKEIEAKCFSKSKLKSIELPSGITEIEEKAFYQCPLNELRSLPSSLKKIGSYAFFGGLFESMSFPASLTEIDESDFMLCTNLKSVNLSPTKVKIISEGAFSYCSTLEEISIEGVTEIGKYGFQWCQKLEKVYIPLSVTTVGNTSFGHCIDIKEITISGNFKTIDKYAFSDSNNLTSVYCYPTTAPTLGTSEPFPKSNVSSRTLFVPKGCTNSYKTGGYGQYFGKIKELS